MRKNFFILLIALSPAVGYAATPQSGARFLGLGVGAREPAMGGAGVAISDDVNASYWNPAGLSRLTSTQFGFTHSEWILDSRYDYVSVAVPTPKMSLGVNGMFFSQPRQQGRDANQNPTGDFSTTDMAVGLAGAFRVGSRLSFGTNIKYLESRIASFSDRGFSADAGSQIFLGNGGKTRLGLAVRNMGPSVGFLDQKDSLPLTTAVGLARQIFPAVLLSTEYGYDVHDHLSQFVVGTEYQMGSALSMRAGYLSGSSNSLNQSQDRRFLSVNGLVGGLGFNIAQFKVDYAFTPFGDLGAVHRISIISQFGSVAPTPTIAKSVPKAPEEAKSPERVIFELPYGWQSTNVPYIVKQGDTLRSIALAMYGRESFWQRILVANPLVIQDPEKLTPGQKIFIPRE